MREFRRTMACRNPDSPALSPIAAGIAAIPGAHGAPSASPNEPAPPSLGESAAISSSASAAARPARTTPRPSQAGAGRSSASAPTRPPPSRTKRTPAQTGAPDFAIERARLDRGARFVAGVDEAGRGPLAGPVVAAAVILDPADMPAGLNDSKQLTASERERLFAEILASARVSVASASAGEIDRIDIRQATLLAMTRALAGLDLAPCHAIVDGRDVPAAWSTRGTAVIEGDARSLSIAAASIVAKVTRDRMMTRLCTIFPVYGFSRHMGYATAEHRLALGTHGPCPYHRMTFSPIRHGVLDFG